MPAPPLAAAAEQSLAEHGRKELHLHLVLRIIGDVLHQYAAHAFGIVHPQHPPKRRLLLVNWLLVGGQGQGFEKVAFGRAQSFEQRRLLLGWWR